jgi:allophanate hydrolase subunit 2
MTYYCARCANQCGIRPAPPSTDFLATQYQREKHQKHTIPASSHRIQSIFDNQSPDYYRDTMLEAYKRGAIEVTSRVKDVLFCPSTQSSIGYKQSYGLHIDRQDTVRVVKSDDWLRVQSFLNASSDHSRHRCDCCSGPLFAST